MLWLKAFDSVLIDSVFLAKDDTKNKRKFKFSGSIGIDGESCNVITDDIPRSTTVHLNGFKSDYRNRSPKTVDAIAKAICEHCLWYCIREGGLPNTTVKDRDESVSLESIYEKMMRSSTESDSAQIKGINLDLIHVRLRSVSSSHSIEFCANNRLVENKSISAKDIPGLASNLLDVSGNFTYACYVSSEFLDEKVRPERNSFDILESKEDLFEDTEISMEEIRGAVVKKAMKYLDGFLVDNLQRTKERINHYVARKAPRYRSILPRIPDSKLNIDLSISERELELFLHKHLFEFESEILKEGHELMVPEDTDSAEEYMERIKEYLEKIDDIKKSDLAGYVSHRKVVLDLLEMAIRRNEDGKYAREELIHNLIMPMRKTSDELSFDECNLWLIDERLAFHSYLASDKTLKSMATTGDISTKEPDLAAFKFFDNPIFTSEAQHPPFNSITLVELKRPMRNDAAPGEDKDPIEQTLGYLERIQEGNVTTVDGRPITYKDHIPSFCYVLCDLTKSVRKRCKVLGMTETQDGLGYFMYNANYKAYIEVISFDLLVKSAKERNRSFFDKLGLPTS